MAIQNKGRELDIFGSKSSKNRCPVTIEVFEGVESISALKTTIFKIAILAKVSNGI